MPVEILGFNSESPEAIKLCTAGSVCILPISVGQEYYQNEAWDQTVSVINQHFTACIIVVVDHLHRFTEKMLDPMDADMTNAEDVALKAGQKWINMIEARWAGKDMPEKKAKHIPKFTIPYTITRWQDWTKCEPVFSEKLAWMNEMYHPRSPWLSDDEYFAKYEGKKIEGFESLVNLVALEFAVGFARKLEKLNATQRDIGEQTFSFKVDEVIGLSQQYLLEELAMVAMCQSGQLPFSTFSEPARKKIETATRYYMPYFFSQNSTNKVVAKCFFPFVNPGKFEFLNLVDSKKSASQKKEVVQKKEPVACNANQSRFKASRFLDKIPEGIPQTSTPSSSAVPDSQALTASLHPTLTQRAEEGDAKERAILTKSPATFYPRSPGAKLNGSTLYVKSPDATGRT